MIYYTLTIINLVLALVSMYTTIMILVKFNVAKRWIGYIHFKLTILVGITLVHCYNLYNPPGLWQHRLVSTIIIFSTFYFAMCLKKSSIKKS